MGILVYPFGVYTMLSSFGAIAGIVIGIKEVKNPGKTRSNIIGIVGNLVYLYLYIGTVAILWPALMGI
jgi:hypothetical protein